MKSDSQTLLAYDSIVTSDKNWITRHSTQTIMFVNTQSGFYRIIETG